ncbi:MAG: sigma-54 interaction domain-containing protein [bacterium]
MKSANTEEPAGIIQVSGNYGREAPPEIIGYHDLVGRSLPMQNIYKIIDKVSQSDITVLIQGESGTGKELVARAIYQNSPRRGQPFVTINCSAIPETLLESELFGHEKGSFTGAHKQRIGRLESAQKGTLFLDEIGEIPLSVQVKLLRFLQEREIERIGGKKPIPLDVRVIAATNKDLKEEVQKSRFREDLFFRLSIVPIQLPSLRERPEDIMLLANYFLDKYRAEANHKIIGFSNELVSLMLSYKWHGNVRELESKLRRGIILSNGRLLSVGELGFLEHVDNSEKLSLSEIRNQAESKAIRLNLELTQGNISNAAKRLKISRPTLHDLLKKHKIDPKLYKNRK